MENISWNKKENSWILFFIEEKHPILSHWFSLNDHYDKIKDKTKTLLVWKTQFFITKSK